MTFRRLRVRKATAARSQPFDAGSPGKIPEALAGRQHGLSQRKAKGFRLIRNHQVGDSGGWLTLGIYYLLPWIRWDRGPGLPSIRPSCSISSISGCTSDRSRSGRRNSTTSPACWSLSALGLFLVTSVAGRVWCGYACPQTVWTDLMIAVERFWQGDRNAAHAPRQGALDGSISSGKQGLRRIHLLDPHRACSTGGAFVFYFRDAPTLARLRSLTGTAPTSPICSSASSRSRPICSAASRASRSAPTCARGRAFRARCSTSIRCSSPIATIAASRAARTRRGRELGRAAAIASTARNAFSASRLPDGHRHPRRRAARMHPVRAVHRRLRRGHGEGRPAARADRGPAGSHQSIRASKA
jgi:hypothetical protein